jgi:hypothetical protein
LRRRERMVMCSSRGFRTERNLPAQVLLRPSRIKPLVFWHLLHFIPVSKSSRSLGQMGLPGRRSELYKRTESFSQDTSTLIGTIPSFSMP